VETSCAVLGHDVPLKLEAKKIIARPARGGPTYGFNEKDAGVRDNAPTDIHEPELAQSALKL